MSTTTDDMRAGDPSSARATPQVLVIEDDADIRELVATRLVRLGYRVRQASTGESGLVEIRERRPDLLVLDVLLPGIDGWEVLGRVRRDPTTRQLPVLVLSIAGDEPPDGLIEPGEYLPKPFAARRFTEAVHRLLHRGGTP